MGGSKPDPERLSEFAMIAKHFAPLSEGEPGALGLLDDAAVLDVPQGQQLVVTADTLISGVHFVENASPGDIAAKALAANVSDLAAMGAGVKWIFLSLSLPKDITDNWLSDFANSLKAGLDQYGATLAGGDTVQTTGPLAVSITAMGWVGTGLAMKRSGAKPFDDIWVSGTLGDAQLGLELIEGNLEGISAEDGQFLMQRHHRPEPRTKLGLGLGETGLANACIDISDGLVADLGHICSASGVSAVIHVDKLALSDVVRTLGRVGERAALGGGDDYELLFTATPEQRGRIEALGTSLGLALSRIGETGNETTHTVRVVDGDANPIEVSNSGWRHF